MQPETPLMAPGQTSTLAITQNRVLRNTYLLLAASLVPTILGAWIGVQTHFTLFGGHPAIGFALFLVIAIGFMFLGFTFFMGLMLSGLLAGVLQFANGFSLIALAFGGTAAIFAAMATIASTTKRDLSGLSKFLFVGVIMLLIAGFANIFLQLPALTIAFSLVAIGIFSAFMLVDVNRIVTGGETNYITATLALYLDIYNVFANLLALLGIFGGNNE